MCTYNDRSDADSGQHLLDQSVAIVQGLHHHALLSGHLRERREEFWCERHFKCSRAGAECFGSSPVDRGDPRSAAGSSGGPSSRTTAAPWSSSAQTQHITAQYTGQYTIYWSDFNPLHLKHQAFIFQTRARLKKLEENYYETPTSLF